MVYQPVQYQTPYTSSYSPGGSNSDFTENPAMYYVKQSYLNYASHSNNHHANSHASSYHGGNSPISNSNSGERNYPHSTSDPSVVPSALQPPMSYNGEFLHTSKYIFLIDDHYQFFVTLSTLFLSILLTASTPDILPQCSVLLHTGANSNMSSGPSTPTTSAGGIGAHPRYYSGGGWQQHQM